MDGETDAQKLLRMQGEYLDSSLQCAFTVYIKNLDTSASNQDISTHFKSCGVISRINMLGSGSKKYATIDFASEKSIEMALLFNGSVLKGKRIIVQKKKDFDKK
ncbi:hypothetical protein HK407_01g00360 [Ordospora pajunii]|jgi:polyadenylate-binding protein 2|uniref:uncharacterized protein n=1 Tax=Ordospora pajunii TaxID=3039483 RepID=UPI0029526A47|nr:uncharacterized protein HK407_01g00360 [Ordospora pajunii]KAH9412144.1 hypothetical protein HK407_01g00360 [Ordospora pajunii]